MREMAAREERTVEEALLPKTAEGLRFLVRRSMHRPPPWMPDFVLDDFIQVSELLPFFFCLLLSTCFHDC
jgi:hypothetical protein